jgi:hypothetical protein
VRIERRERFTDRLLAVVQFLFLDEPRLRIGSLIAERVQPFVVVADRGVERPRERRVFEARWLIDDPITLEDLAAELGVTPERVHQIELRAFEKVQQAIETARSQNAEN